VSSVSYLRQHLAIAERDLARIESQQLDGLIFRRAAARVVNLRRALAAEVKRAVDAQAGL
jgi:hypothetical protein